MMFVQLLQGWLNQEFGIETVEPRGGMEPLLRGDPDEEGDHSYEHGDPGAGGRAHFILGPPAEKQDAADERLERADPVARLVGPPETVAFEKPFDDEAGEHDGKKSEQWPDMSFFLGSSAKH